MRQSQELEYMENLNLKVEFIEFRFHYHLSAFQIYDIWQKLNLILLLQRVPVTEKSGRVHTSAISVAILPQADEVLNYMN